MALSNYSNFRIRSDTMAPSWLSFYRINTMKAAAIRSARYQVANWLDYTMRYGNAVISRFILPNKRSPIGIRLSRGMWPPTEIFSGRSHNQLYDSSRVLLAATANSRLYNYYCFKSLFATSSIDLFLVSAKAAKIIFSSSKHSCNSIIASKVSLS